MNKATILCTVVALSPCLCDGQTPVYSKLPVRETTSLDSTWHYFWLP
jgi:hypothetical protein